MQRAARGPRAHRHHLLTRLLQDFREPRHREDVVAEWQQALGVVVVNALFASTAGMYTVLPIIPWRAG